jgi:molybdate transport system substrate-binding protein
MTTAIKMKFQFEKLVIGIPFCIIICIALAFAGCTATPPAQVTTPVPTTGTHVTSSPFTPVVTVNATPAVQKTLVSFTAASLKGVSDKIGSAYSNASPGTTVKFNLDGTQVLKTQIENGARADVFISASNSYTNALKNEGYLVNGTIMNLTSNYIIVIVPAGNPGHITSLADLGTPGKKIVMGNTVVPVGVNTRQAITNLVKSTYNETWNSTLYKNVVSYESQEPAVVTKVALGEADAGFVYESSYKAATPGTLNAIVIPVKDNSLQIYTIGITNTTSDNVEALKFETFLLSPQGQQILSDFGFRPMNG